MEKKLNEMVDNDDYDAISRYLDIRKIESYENLGDKFLGLDLNADEVSWYDDSIVGVCKEKFDGNLKGLYDFIKENSRVVRIASTSGTLKVEGTVSMEIDDDQDEDQIDWDGYVDRSEDFDGNVSIEFEGDGYGVEVTTTVKMRPYVTYDDPIPFTENTEAT